MFRVICLVIAAAAMANLWLKEGHNLLEKDMLPVVGRLTSLSQDAWRAKIEDPASVPLASFCKNHLLCSYSGEELADQFHKMTGYEILGILNMSRMEDGKVSRMAACHCAILHANLIGAPKGQSARPVAVQGMSSNTSKASAAVGTPAGQPSTSQQANGSAASGSKSEDEPSRKRPHDDDAPISSEDRIGMLMAEVKQMREEGGGSSVKNLLQQEYFIKDLATTAFRKRKQKDQSLDYTNLATIVNDSDPLQFLQDVVPHKVKVKDYYASTGRKMPKTKEEKEAAKEEKKKEKKPKKGKKKEEEEEEKEEEDGDEEEEKDNSLNENGNDDEEQNDDENDDDDDDSDDVQIIEDD